MVSWINSIVSRYRLLGPVRRFSIILLLVCIVLFISLVLYDDIYDVGELFMDDIKNDSNSIIELFKQKTPVNSPSTVSQIDLSDTMVFYINTDSLDNDSNILDWFFDNGKLCVYTKQDSINDEIERYNYIRSLDPEFGE